MYVVPCSKLWQSNFYKRITFPGECCSEHDRRSVELYCYTCDKMICLECIKNGGKHCSCKYDKLNAIAKTYEGRIKSSLQNMEDRVSQLHAHHNEIFGQQAALLEDINNKTAQLHKLLDDRKSELIQQLYQLTQSILHHRKSR